MKRLLLCLAAVVVAAASPVAVDLAHAKDQGQRAEQRGRGPDRGEGRGGGRRFEGRRDDDRGRGGERGGRRWDDRRDDRRYDRREYEGPRGYPAPYARPRIRPGGRLPPDYRGAQVYDFHRYRLRPPPHGYAWYRTPGAFILVSLVDGQVFDVIPD